MVLHGDDIPFEGAWYTSTALSWRWSERAGNRGGLRWGRKIVDEADEGAGC